MKVKLVFVKSFVDIPTWNDTFSQEVEVGVPAKFGNDVVHMIAARTPGSMAPTSEHPPIGDSNAIIIDHKDFSDILGKLLTYVDATFTDLEQRKAHKDIIKGVVWDWEAKLRERAVQTVDSHTQTAGSSESTDR